NFERQGVATTLRLIVNAMEGVELLDEKITVFADQEDVHFRKTMRTIKQVIFEAANVPPKAFVAARLDGHYRNRPGREPGSYQVSISDLDLDGDTDHTGFVEHSLKEDDLEDRDGEDGIIILPNWADVDPPGTTGHGIP